MRERFVATFMKKQQATRLDEHAKSDYHIGETANSEHHFVDARVIGRRYSFTARYALQLAAQGRIPSLRIGKKCVRFSESAVAEALEKGVAQ